MLSIIDQHDNMTVEDSANTTSSITESDNGANETSSVADMTESDRPESQTPEPDRADSDKPHSRQKRKIRTFRDFPVSQWPTTIHYKIDGNMSKYILD